MLRFFMPVFLIIAPESHILLSLCYRRGRISDLHALTGPQGDLRVRDRHILRYRDGADAAIIDVDPLRAFSLDDLGLMYLDLFNQFVQHQGCQLFDSGVLSHRRHKKLSPLAFLTDLVIGRFQLFHPFDDEPVLYSPTWSQLFTQAHGSP